MRGTVTPGYRAAHPRPPALPHLPGIDGLRAIAVAAVLAYHAGVAALPGGYLGVEVFFVISGYLITALLLTEWSVAGGISLRRFWFRRARRLLPALFLLLGVSLAFAVVWLPGEVARLRSDALAAAAYVSNWYLIAGEQSYFDTAARQSPLLHLWSLAVEEQFYLFWPVVLAIGLRLAGRRGMLALTVAGAAGSTLWAAALFDPAGDPSRVYYGTDARLSGLLVGAALAFVLLPRGRAWGWAGRGVRLAADGAVGLAGAILGAAFVLLAADVEWLHRGGLLVVGLATAALIAGTVHPAGVLGRRVLDVAPLRWLGTRSYGIYLWHWPLFSVTRPGLDVALDGPALLAFRLVAVALLAEVSFRLVERPIRNGAIGRAWQRWNEESWRAAPGSRRGLRTRTTALLAAAALSVSGLLVTVAAASPPERPSWLPAEPVPGAVVGVPGPTTGPTAAPSIAAPSSARPPEPSPLAFPSASAGPAVGPAVLAVGDSMLVATGPALALSIPGIEIDAAVGRQVVDGIAILEARRAAGTLPEVVVVNLGVNGPLFRAQFDRAMEALREVRLVVWVTVAVPRPWEEQTNKVLHRFVPDYANARLADWQSVAVAHPELFWNDGYHPRAEGAALYAEVVATAIAAGG